MTPATGPTRDGGTPNRRDPTATVAARVVTRVVTRLTIQVTALVAVGTTAVGTTAVVVVLATGATFSVGTPGAWAAPAPPAPVETVSDQAIAESVLQIDLVDAVRPINLDKAVLALRTERHDGSGVAVTISSDVLFAFDSAELTDAARSQLTDIAPQIGNAKGTVAVNGYTDSTGTPAYNVILSQRRANAVADLLRPKAPGDVLVTATGQGSANPVAPNTNPDGSDNSPGRAQNRRVTITYRTS
ncbi:OmpA family protein [Frankia sp. Cas4]|uniref:OmpA family protein n=2 Tax=unclassified Frankia TaxID=2632575 RepID=UPI002AD58403|nr:OmpA family protein [Frankia sp. Cas4]